MCENQTAKDLLASLNRLGYLTEEEQYQKQQLERIINATCEDEAVQRTQARPTS